MHPFLRKDEIASFCEAHGIAILAYSPLARAKRLDHPVLRRIAARHAATPAQVLVAWSVAMGYVPLPKSVKAERIDENLAALRLELSDEDMAALGALDERLFTEWEEWGRLDPTELP